MPDVRLNNVSKVYDGFYALDNVTLEIKNGDFVNVVGGSGGGKTTLLRCLAGLTKVSAGEMYFDGELVNDLSANERNVAMIFQDFALYPHMTVFENVMTALKRTKLSYEEKCDAVFAVLEKLRITFLSGEVPEELSYGQRQMAALARALVRRPALVLFDEPLSNVDAPRREEYKKLIVEAKNALPDATFLYVTHNLSDALMLGNKTAVLDKGRVLRYGGTRDVFAYPQSLSCASYLFPAAVEEAERKEGEWYHKGEKLTLSPFERASMRGNNRGKGVLLTSDHGRCLYDEEGQPLFGPVNHCRLPCILEKDTLTAEGVYNPLGEFADGVLATGKGFLLFPCDKLSEEPLPESLCLPAVVKYADDRFSVADIGECPVVLAGKAQEGARLRLYVPFSDVCVTDEEGRPMLSHYVVYPNVCRAKVLNKNTGRVSVGGFRLCLQRPLAGKTVLLAFSRTAFAATEGKGLRVSDVFAEEKQGRYFLDYLEIAGFDRYVTVETKGDTGFLGKEKIRLSVDVSQIEILAEENEVKK